jgi:hypothetical protein
MSKYNRIKSYSPKKAVKPTKKPVKRGPVPTFFVNKWKWFKGLSKPKKVAVIGGPIAAFLILTPLRTYTLLMPFQTQTS